jgi:hypothetical protein
MLATRRMGLRRVALLTVGLGCSQLQTGLVTPTADFRGGLPASIVRVESFGLWSQGERQGSLRIVVTRGCSPERCFDRTFLQWLDTLRDEEGRSLEAEEGETTEIDELGDFTFVERITPAPSVQNPGRFQLDAAHSHSGEPRAICITPAAPGAYTAREGPC